MILIAAVTVSSALNAFLAWRPLKTVVQDTLLSQLTPTEISTMSFVCYVPCGTCVTYIPYTDLPKMVRKHYQY